MPKFEVEVQRYWIQSGIVTVEADSISDAHELVGYMDADTETIDWDAPEYDTGRRMKTAHARQLKEP